MREIDFNRGEGDVLYEIVSDLYPICRSITGDGFRESLRYLQKFVNLRLVEIPTGTKVYDWEVPNEWNIKDAWIKNSKGEKVVDFRQNNLHVVNYSMGVKQTM